MKALGGRQASDHCVFGNSDYLLSRDYVNQYAHEVTSRRQHPNVTGSQQPPPGSSAAPHAGSTTEASDDAANGVEDREFETPDNDEGDPTDNHEKDVVADHGADVSCVMNWKAAANNDKKKTLGVYDEAGVFLTAC